MYYYQRNKKSKKRGNKKWIVAVVVVIILLAGGFYWWHSAHKPASEIVTKAGKFTSSASKSDTSSASPKKTPSSNTTRVIGGGSDTKGRTSANTNPDEWVVSKSGNITVQQPVANSTLQNGSVLSGTAKVGAVNFRLIDNQVGVISEGTLSVVNGKFSGKIAFASHSSSGQLDVYSTNSKGVELNEVQIAVKF